MRHITLFIFGLLLSTPLFASTAITTSTEAALTSEQMQACLAAHQNHAEPPADCPTQEAVQNHAATCQEAYRNNAPLPAGCPTLQEVQQKAACLVAKKHNTVVSGCE